MGLRWGEQAGAGWGYGWRGGGGACRVEMLRREDACVLHASPWHKNFEEIVRPRRKGSLLRTLSRPRNINSLPTLYFLPVASVCLKHELFDGLQMAPLDHLQVACSSEAPKKSLPPQNLRSVPMLSVVAASLSRRREVVLVTLAQPVAVALLRLVKIEFILDK